MRVMSYLTHGTGNLILVALALVVAVWVSGCQQEHTVTPTPEQAETPTPREHTATPTPEQAETPTPLVMMMEVDLACGPYDHSESSESSSQRHFVQWALGGSQLIFGFDEAVWTVDAGGTSLRNVVDANPGVDSYGDQVVFGSSPDESKYGFHADLSPDGSRIVYSTCQYSVKDLDTWRINSGERGGAFI